MHVSSENRPIFALFAVWRLLAALLVMFYHFCEFGPVAYQEFAEDMEVLSPMLDLFFIISGFLIWVHYAPKLHSVSDYWVFLLRRFARLYPLHMATLSVFCLAWIASLTGQFATTITEHYNFVEFFKQILLINAWGLSDHLTFNFVSWSLSAEWFCYIAFPLLLLVFRKAGLLGLIALLGLCVVALEGLTYLKVIPFPTWLDANTWGAYRVFSDFVLGAIIADLSARKLFAFSSHLLAWGAMVFAILIMVSEPEWGYWSIVAIAVALFIAAQVEINAPESSNYLRPILPLCFVSFGIYMWHVAVAVVVLGLGWKRLAEPLWDIGFLPFLILGMALTIVTAMVSASRFEAPLRQKILSSSTKPFQSSLGTEKA